MRPRTPKYPAFRPRPSPPSIVGRAYYYERLGILSTVDEDGFHVSVRPHTKYRRTSDIELDYIRRAFDMRAAREITPTDAWARHLFLPHDPAQFCARCNERHQGLYIQVVRAADAGDPEIVCAACVAIDPQLRETLRETLRRQAAFELVSSTPPPGSPS